ncbi:MAG: hypothetical protein K6T80_04920 [Firmicutes bacterium]|nr:hypothetical protein [Bacillota bacterium]
MMDFDDFDEIRRLLEKSCDNCLLTRLHCKTCRIEKLFGVINQFSRSKATEVFLVPAEEMETLTGLAAGAAKPGQKEYEVVVKWRAALGELLSKTGTA